MTTRPPTPPAPVTWRGSLVISCAVHGALLLGLWFGTDLLRPRGSPPRDVLEAHLEFLPPSEPRERVEREPEPESELEVEPVEEEFLVRETPFEPEPIDPDSPIERLEWIQSAIETRPPDDWPKDPPVEEPPPPEPPPVVPSESSPIEEIAPPEPTSGDRAGDESLPRPIHGACADPAYPARAALRRLEGEVLCRITVGADGSVVSVVVEESSGHDELDRAAREALSKWRFEPGRRGGAPAEMVVWKRILFQLP